MKDKLIKAFTKLAVFLAVFVASAYVTSSIINQGNTDLTAEMKKATLPLIYVNVNGEYINCLHGYTLDMEGSYLRGNITPMSAERTIPIKIKTYDTVVTSVDYEVRTLNMERLLEKANIQTFSYENNEITATIPVKDLIEDEQEYMLIIKLSLSDGRIASYYCRFINKAELYLSEKIDFVRDFSSKTFDKEMAKELITYMESNAEGDNSSYGYVNIHSSFNQLTWGELEPVLESEKELSILDIDNQDASIRLKYTISAKGELYNVEEYFLLTRGSERIYLMDYERKMNQIFDEDNALVANGKIFHGILNDPIEYKENSTGNVFCFVQDHRLYSYNADMGSIARIFSFWDKDNDDARTKYESNDLKILYVDDSGNVYFAVYGYMDRGNHEGEVGIAVYHYDCAFNTIEENMFIPYSKSYEILKHDVEALCYVNKNGHLYLMFNGTIYNIDLETTKAELIASGLNETRFVSSKDNSMIGWQPSDNLYEYDTLKFMSLNEMTPTEIKAEALHILVPLGFFNHDFVYGSVKITDIRLDATGRTVLPMDYIYIQNLGGEILKKYGYQGTYVVDVEFQDNMINLSRVVIDDDTDMVYRVSDDQIMNNEDKEAFKNEYKSVITEEMETTWQTVLKNASTRDNMRVLTPKEVLYEGNKKFYLNVKDILNRYYVYSKGSVESIYTDAADAVYDAESIDGTVINKKCDYIWKPGDRKKKALIEGIDVNQIELQGQSSVSVCIEQLLKTADVYVDASELLSKGETPIDIMQKNLESGEAIVLSGCSLNAMLYYVSNGYPVMAMVEDEEAVLIVGYDANNIQIFNPLEGKIVKKGIKDSSLWFSTNGNRFLTYVR